MLYFEILWARFLKIDFASRVPPRQPEAQFLVKKSIFDDFENFQKTQKIEFSRIPECPATTPKTQKLFFWQFFQNSQNRQKHIFDENTKTAIARATGRPRSSRDVHFVANRAAHLFKISAKMHKYTQICSKPAWSKTGFKQNRFQPKPVFAIGANRFQTGFNLFLMEIQKRP